ncbi:MAG: hypothetical protein WC495_06460 [Patescibacteria group bacterium]|jgi:hypothetical protein
MKKIKILMALAGILAVLGVVQLLTLTRPQIVKQEVRALSSQEKQLLREKVNTDHRIETLRDRIKTRSQESQLKNELESAIAERDKVKAEMDKMKNEQLQNSQLEEQKEKRATTQMYLTFIGSLVTALTSIVLAILNKKKE